MSAVDVFNEDKSRREDYYAGEANWLSYDAGVVHADPNEVMPISAPAVTGPITSHQSTTTTTNDMSGIITVVGLGLAVVVGLALFSRFR